MALSDSWWGVSFFSARRDTRGPGGAPGTPRLSLLAGPTARCHHSLRRCICDSAKPPEMSQKSTGHAPQDDPPVLCPGQGHRAARLCSQGPCAGTLRRTAETVPSCFSGNTDARPPRGVPQEAAEAPAAAGPANKLGRWLRRPHIVLVAPSGGQQASWARPPWGASAPPFEHAHAHAPVWTDTAQGQGHPGHSTPSPGP